MTDYKAQQVLKRMVRCNTLTICSQKQPEYYLKLIRYHFMNSEEETLSLQALGLSCQNLIYVSCLVTLKGYAIYKRIKNDHLSVPVADSRTGAHLGLLKKIRLTVKLTRSENFKKIIQSEIEEQQKHSKLLHSGERRFKNDENDGAKDLYEIEKENAEDLEEVKFDQEDLVLKSRTQIE